MLLGVTALAGCRERERLVFTSPTGNGSGPTVAITAPHRDTTIHVGDTLTIVGYATDPDGVDSVWFTVQGIPFTIQPIAGGGADTVFFNQHFNGSAFPDTGTVRFFASAVDVTGDTGLTKSLTITVKP